MTAPRTRIERLEVTIHPARPPDLDRLTAAERRELDDILADVRPGGDLSGLSDDALDRLKVLLRRAGAA